MFWECGLAHRSNHALFDLVQFFLKATIITVMILLMFSEPLRHKTAQRITMPENTGELGRIDLGDITPHNIKLLRKVNTVVFPVSYHDKFYKVSTQIYNQNISTLKIFSTAGCAGCWGIGQAGILQ